MAGKAWQQDSQGHVYKWQQLTQCFAPVYHMGVHLELCVGESDGVLLHNAVIGCWPHDDISFLAYSLSSDT